MDLCFDEEGLSLGIGTANGNIHVFKVPETSSGSLTASFMPKESLAESVIFSSAEENCQKVTLYTGGQFCKINIGPNNKILALSPLNFYWSFLNF